MRSLRFLLAVSLLAALAPASRAEFYLKAAGLYHQASDISVDNASAFRASLKRNAGFAGAWGYAFAPFRVEAELQYARRAAAADETSGTLFGGIGATSGALSETTVFANGCVDLPGLLGVSPYAGVGVGLARANLDDLTRTRNGAPTLQFSGSDTVFAVQALLGLQVKLPHGAVHAGYRFLQSGDMDVHDVLANAGRSVSIGHHGAFELGVSIRF